MAEFVMRQRSISPDCQRPTWGPYTTYVAWLATPVTYPVVRHGVVRNGLTTLSEIALDKFVVLVTAEGSASAKQPTGRILLYGKTGTIEAGEGG